MSKIQLVSITACAALALGLSACNRAEAPAEVSRNVAAAEIERLESIAAARADQVDVHADTATAAVSLDTQERVDAFIQQVEARHETAMAALEGDRNVQYERCEALGGGAHTTCRRQADAAFDIGKANAERVLETELGRADAASP